MLYPVAKIIQYSVQVLLLQLFAAKRKAKSANLKVVQMNLMRSAVIGLPILITFLTPSKVQLYGFVVVTLSASP